MTDRQTNLKLGAPFAWLNITQFLGALNDNIFRMLIVFFLIGIHGEERSGDITSTTAFVFVVPFLLFTALAGKMADRFSKRSIIVAVKTAEVAVMLLAVLAFMSGSPTAVYAVLFLMCAQSAFFSPGKYGIVPELVRTEQLSRANSFLEAMTYTAIVIGAAIAPFLSRITNRNYALALLTCVAFAVVGLITSLRIKLTPAAAPAPAGGDRASIIFLRDIIRTLASIWHDKGLVLAVMASAYFMLIGAFLQMNLIPYGMDALGLDREQSGYLFVVAAVGIGIGAYLAGRLSGRNIEFGIVPFGAIGLAVTSIALGLIAPQHLPETVIAATDAATMNTPPLTAVIVTIVFMGISAGLFIVPVHASLQFRSPDRSRGQVIAAANFLGWVGVLFSAILFNVCMVLLHISAAKMFLVLGVLTFILAAATLIKLPDFFVRFVIIVIVRICYRIRVIGQDNVPLRGGTLLVSNHVTWMDALLIGATQQRRIRFVMDRNIYNHSILKPILRLMGIIRISENDPPKQILRSLRQARQAMDDGFIVCIFAEGAITRTGMLRRFKGGFERIMKNSDYSVIPTYIGGTWGSVFSWYHGRLLWAMPRRFPYPVNVHFGKPIAATATTDHIRQKVMELSCDYFETLKEKRNSLGDHFVRTARKNWSKPCISDTTGRRLNYGKTLTAAIAIAHQIKQFADDDKNIGILLPPSAAGAIANIAVTLAGKVPVNLSYVAGAQARDHAIEQCDIKYIISSKKFIEKSPVNETLDGLVFMEDLAGRIDGPARRRAYIKARFMPRRILTNARRFNPDDPAAILFSSGSTGLPKGVVLSHHNILSNIHAMRMVFKIYPNDRLCGVLPFFHAFGLTATLWLPLTTGVSANYIPNPLDGSAVANSIRQNKSTVLMATPTFLLSYIRRARREDFATLRQVVLGAEKLKKKLADAFEEKFGIRPLEGYGATELSPLATLSLPDVELGGVSQVGTKPGSVGHPIPGTAVKVIDPQTQAVLGPDQPGLLMVKGPNVMLGYLNDQKKTDSVIKDGWYNTGDIVTIDQDGFITITDRLSRFSKIGGEMVPHIALEEVCLSAVHSADPAVAVTGIPHPTKGEELVVLYVPHLADPDKMHQAVSDSDLPNICKPRRNNYLPVQSIPILGSGKLDIMKLRQLAAHHETDTIK